MVVKFLGVRSSVLSRSCSAIESNAGKYEAVAINNGLCFFFDLCDKEGKLLLDIFFGMREDRDSEFAHENLDLNERIEKRDDVDDARVLEEFGDNESG